MSVVQQGIHHIGRSDAPHDITLRHQELSLRHLCQKLQPQPGHGGTQAQNPHERSFERELQVPRVSQGICHPRHPQRTHADGARCYGWANRRFRVRCGSRFTDATSSTANTKSDCASGARYWTEPVGRGFGNATTSGSSNAGRRSSTATASAKLPSQPDASGTTVASLLGCGSQVTTKQAASVINHPNITSTRHTYTHTSLTFDTSVIYLLSI